MAVALEEGGSIAPNAPTSTHSDELCIRTSWVDAATALTHINKVNSIKPSFRLKIITKHLLNICPVL